MVQKITRIHVAYHPEIALLFICTDKIVTQLRQDMAVPLWWPRVRDHPGGGLPITGVVEKKTWWVQSKES